MKTRKAPAAGTRRPSWGCLFLSVLLVCAALSNVTCHAQDHERKNLTITFLDGNGREACRFLAELSLTPTQREQGLMFRTYMRRNTGMLFVEESDVMQNFWMKNTCIPLDIVFINGSYEVVHVHAGARPHDEKTISSRYPARYVLEINAGEARECSIRRGTKVQIGRISLRP